MTVLICVLGRYSTIFCTLLSSLPLWCQETLFRFRIFSLMWYTCMWCGRSCTLIGITWVPITTASTDAFELPAVSCYLPVQRIRCRAAHAVMCERLLVECSIHPFAGLWQYRSYCSIPACTTILCCRGYSNNLPWCPSFHQIKTHSIQYFKVHTYLVNSWCNC